MRFEISLKIFGFRKFVVYNSYIIFLKYKKYYNDKIYIKVKVCRLVECVLI